MERRLKVLSGKTLAALLFIGTIPATDAKVFAQEPNPTAQTNPDANVIEKEDGVYLYRVKVV